MMAKLHEISIDGAKVYAHTGDVVLDAALAGGADIPYDCRSGRCGTCVARIKHGITLGGEVAHQPDFVYACQAMVFSDLELEIEERPPAVVAKGRITDLRDVVHDTVEVVIETTSPMDILPGQYCRFRFKGFPDRAFSPTAPLDGIPLESKRRIRLNIKRIEGGHVTSALGTRITAGHLVRIEGPFGRAFHRPNLTKRLVLVGSGTGFAPVWAVAAAALRENPARRIVLIAATRSPGSFYMAETLDLAARFANTEVVACVSELNEPMGRIRPGSPLIHLPKDLGSDDMVYAAGGPSLVDVLGRVAAKCDAAFFSDPFEPANPPRTTWSERAKAWIAAM